ncbi:hypothetical protein ABT173_39110 [Streptomyces sp. NPDC001795]|uniref:hypothetical protein n=1 Tax=unclassified Streptomyces TaxID=2593676 RepID=UPI00331B6859
MLHVTSLIAVSVVLVLYAVAGVLALTTGRIVRWQRGRLVRPRLWGAGALLSCAGVALWRYVTPTVHDMTALDVLFGGGMVLFLSGVLLQFLGQRVGRVPSA